MGSRFHYTESRVFWFLICSKPLCLSLAYWFPLSSQGIRHQNNVFYLSPLPPSPLLLCQMTNAHLMTDTPYQGSKLANVSKYWQGSKLISGLTFAGIFNLLFLSRAIDIGTSSSTKSLPFGSPGQFFSTSIADCVFSKETSANTEPKTFQSSSHFKTVVIEAMNQILAESAV